MMSTTKVLQISESARILSEKVVRFLSPTVASQQLANIVSRLLPTVEGHLTDLQGSKWTVIRWGAYDFLYPGLAPQQALLKFGTGNTMTIDDILKAARMGALMVFHFNEPMGLMLQADRSMEYDGAVEVNDVLFEVDFPRKEVANG